MNNAMNNDDMLQRITRTAITPALQLLPPRLDSLRARQMLLAIGLQESRFTHRVQIVDGGGIGPARSFWQFERGGGVRGVLTHEHTQALAVAVCKARGVEAEPRAVWTAMERDDILGAAFARLLLWSHPASLPGEHDAEAGWHYYMRTWRPGKPHRHTWDAFYTRARRAVFGTM